MQRHPADDIAIGNAGDSTGIGEADGPNDAAGSRSDRRVLTALFAAIGLLTGTDVVMDCIGGADLGHVGFEATVFAVAAGGLFVLWRRIAAVRSVAGALKCDLAAARADAERWRSDSRALLSGLGAAIDRQFGAWGLSGAEREVALLLLKGMSLKEIARIRGTSERTVRQQALAVYRKGGIAGRAELSAFFLEDLLLPAGPDHSLAPSPRGLQRRPAVPIRLLECAQTADGRMCGRCGCERRARRRWPSRPSGRSGSSRPRCSSGRRCCAA
jgi:DNA-binding CsgD family transcriptional regulator